MTIAQEDLSISSLICTYSYSTLVVLIATCIYMDSIFTRSQIIINEYTIVLIVSGIDILITVRRVTLSIVVVVSLDNVTCLVTQYYLRTVDWIVHVVVATASVVVVLVNLFLFGTDITHDITLALTSSTEVFLDTTSKTQALLTAPVGVQRTVASWLVSVEITFSQSTWTRLVVQYTVVPTVHTHTTDDSHIGCRVSSIILHTACPNIPNIWPHRLTTSDTTRSTLVAGVTLDEERWVVGCLTKIVCV